LQKHGLKLALDYYDYHKLASLPFALLFALMKP